MVSGGGGGIEPPNKGFAEPSYTIDVALFSLKYFFVLRSAITRRESLLERTHALWSMGVLGIDGGQCRQGRHIDTGGRGILNTIRTVFGSVKGMVSGIGGKGGHA